MLFRDETTGKACYNLNVLIPKVIFLITIPLIVFVLSYYLRIRIRTVERKLNSVVEFEPALWREDIDSAIQAAQERQRFLLDEPPPPDFTPKTRRRAKSSRQLV